MILDLIFYDLPIVDFFQMEKLKESHRKTDENLRKQTTNAQKGEEEAKRLNEEFKKKVIENF